MFGLTGLSAVFLVAVLVGGIVMAVKSASANTFMGLVCLGAGILLVMMGAYYQKNPNYKDSSGEARVAGPGMIRLLFGMAVLLIAGGLYILVVGIGP